MTESIVADAVAKLSVLPKPVSVVVPKVPDKPEAAVKSEPVAKSEPLARPSTAPESLPPVALTLPGHKNARKQLAIAASAAFSLIAGIAGFRLLWPAGDETNLAPAQSAAGDVKPAASESPSPSPATSVSTAATVPPTSPSTSPIIPIATFQPAPVSSGTPPATLPVAPVSPSTSPSIAPLTPPAPAPTGFKITDHAIELMQSWKVPDSIVAKLAPLKNRDFSKQDLTWELTKLLTSQETIYEDTIFYCCNESLKPIANPAAPVRVSPPASAGIAPPVGLLGPQPPAAPGAGAVAGPSAPAAPLASSMRYTITDDSITALSLENVPLIVTVKLSRLKNKDFTQSELEKELAYLLTADEAQKYQTAIERSAKRIEQPATTGSSGSNPGLVPSMSPQVAIVPPPAALTPPPPAGLVAPALAGVQVPGVGPASPAAPALTPGDPFTRPGTQPRTSGTTGAGLPGTPSIPTAPAVAGGPLAPASPVTPIGGVEPPRGPAAPAIPGVVPTSPTAPAIGAAPSVPPVIGSPVTPAAQTVPGMPVAPAAPMGLAPIPAAPQSPSAPVTVDVKPKPAFQPAAGTVGSVPTAPVVPPAPLSTGTGTPSVLPEPVPGSALTPKPSVTIGRDSARLPEAGRGGSSEIGAVASTVKPVASTSVAPAIERTPTTSYDVDLYEVKLNDTWESISQEYYNTKSYAAALKAANKNLPVPTGTIDIPPIYILKQKFAPRSGMLPPSGPSALPSGTPISTGPAWSPSVATTRAAPAGVGKTYTVPAGGANMRAIARTILGDDQKWTEIYNLNPWCRSDAIIPAGTVLRVPSNANVP